MDGLETARKWQAAFANDDVERDLRASVAEDMPPRKKRRDAKPSGPGLCKSCGGRSRGHVCCASCRKLNLRRVRDNNAAKLCLRLSCSRGRDGYSMYCAEHRR